MDSVNNAQSLILAYMYKLTAFIISTSTGNTAFQMLAHAQQGKFKIKGQIIS